MTVSEAPERVWVAVEATKDWVGEAFMAPDPADPCDYTEYVRADLTGLASLAAPPDAERIARLEALLSRMEASTRTDGGQGTMLMLPMSDQKYQGIHAATLDLLGEVRTALADTPRRWRKTMVDYVTLLGAEDVRSAGQTIRHAAEAITAAASNMEHSLQMHQRFLDDWLQRFQEVMAKDDVRSG